MILHQIFSIPILQIPADEETYDTIQIEVKKAWEKIQTEKNYGDLSYYNKKTNDTKLKEKTYDFIENFNCLNLKHRIESTALDYITKSGWSGNNKKTSIRIKNSWLNVIENGNSHGKHCHPGYTISGVYYFRIDGGPISFSNPNPIIFACNFPQGNICPQNFSIFPTRGDIILFPSWLVHGTLKNTSNEDRISVAFNIDIINQEDHVEGLIKSSHIPIMNCV